jgi:ketosteroid isomerase-like protein
MTESSPPVDPGAAPPDLREVHRRVVRRYFEVHGEERMGLFAADAVKEIPFWSIDGEPRRVVGAQALRENFLRNTVVFANWGWSELKLYDTQNADEFFVECRGSGAWRGAADGSARPYSNHYLMHFTLADGKIVRLREFMNPLLTAVATGGAMQGVQVKPL